MLLGPDTLDYSLIHHMVMELGNKTTTEFRTAFHSPLRVLNSYVPLYCKAALLEPLLSLYQLNCFLDLSTN